MRQWILACVETHARCSQSPNSDLPTRLLDLCGGEALQDIILVETDQLFSQLRYATLSHLWGTHQPLTTSKASLNSRKQGIIMDALPQTYRDAIRVCRALEVRYLWLDSLCIVQDDESDWVA